MTNLNNVILITVVKSTFYRFIKLAKIPKICALVLIRRYENYKSKAMLFLPCGSFISPIKYEQVPIKFLSRVVYHIRMTVNTHTHTHIHTV